MRYIKHKTEVAREFLANHFNCNPNEIDVRIVAKDTCQERTGLCIEATYDGKTDVYYVVFLITDYKIKEKLKNDNTQTAMKILRLHCRIFI